MFTRKSIPVRLVVVFFALNLVFLTLGMSSGFTTENSQDKYITLAVGDSHIMALKEDGTVWSWGSNSNGQLGNGDRQNVAIPTKINSLSNVIEIDANSEYSLALKNDGTVWAWGENAHGELGDASIEKSLIPLQIIGIEDIIAISAGGTHCAALKKDGTVWTWGRNYYGQIGNGEFGGKQSTPMQVKGILDVKAIASGDRHTMALKNDGTVWVWGDNEYGQLGTGTKKSSDIPIQIAYFEGIKSISAGVYHSLAIKNDGSVWTWGNNEYGQLGNSMKENGFIPTKVEGLENIKSVTAGKRHSIALQNNGAVWIWGNNHTGQLGDSYLDESLKPLLISGLSNIETISTHISLSTALDADGLIWTWGDNISSLPKQILSPGTNSVAEDDISVNENKDTPKNDQPSETNTIILKLNDPYMIVNGISKEIDPGKGTSPSIKEERTMIPIRALIETLGGSVGWESSENKITISFNSRNLEMWIAKKVIKVDNEEKDIDVAPVIVNGRTMIPVRFVTENLGCTVGWDDKTKEITITYVGEIPTIEPDIIKQSGIGEGLIEGKKYILNGKVLFEESSDIIEAILSPDNQYVAYTYTKMEIKVYNIKDNSTVMIYEIPFSEAFGSSYYFSSVSGSRLKLMKWTSDSNKIIYKKYSSSGFEGSDGYYEISKSGGEPIVTKEIN